MARVNPVQLEAEEKQPRLSHSLGDRYHFKFEKGAKKVLITTKIAKKLSDFDVKELVLAPKV